jgi:hypothetical protein
MLLRRNRLLFSTLLIVLLYASLILSVKAEATMWVKTYGGPGQEYARSLVASSDGGYAITGYIGTNNGDCWLVKTDADGNMEWNQTYGGDLWDYAYCLVETSDGGYAIAGSTHSVSHSIYDDAWLVKTDADGNMEWNQTYGTEDNYEGFYSLVETSDGGYALAGYRSSGALSGYNVWLAKTDAYGNMQWNETYGDSGFYSDWGRSLVATSDGGYAIAGCKNNDDFLLVKTDVDGNIQWIKTYGGEGVDEAHSLVETSDGGYAITGTWNSLSDLDANGDCWLVKTDADGNMEWNMTYGGEGHDEAYSLVETSDGGYAIAGTWSYEDWILIGYDEGVHTGAFWLVKTGADGNMEWNMTYGGGVIDGAFSLVAALDGGYALAGFTRSFGVDGSEDFWLVKTDENGVAPVVSEAEWVILPLLLTATLTVFASKKKLFHTQY